MPKFKQNKTSSLGLQAQKNWSSKSLASNWQHAFFYSSLRLLGLAPAKFFLFFVVLFYTLRPSIYRRSLYYLHRRFGPAKCFKRFTQVFCLYWQFGVILLERAAGGILGRLRINTRPQDATQLTNLLEEGRGVIFISAHVGCWQIAISALRFNRVVNLVHPRSENDVDKHFFEHGGNINLPKIKLLDPRDEHGGFIVMTSALLRGEMLCIMADRLTQADRLAVEVDFLGGKIVVPGSVYLLASITGVPIVISFSYRTGACEASNYIYATLNLPKGLDKSPQAIKPYAQKFADGLEEYCQAYPYQFFNFHDIWTLTEKVKK